MPCALLSRRLGGSLLSLSLSLCVSVCVCLLLSLSPSASALLHQEAEFDLFAQIYNLADRGIVDADRVRLVLDVGAFEGEFSTTLRESGKFPHAQYVCVEANSDMQAVLTAKGLPHVIAVVGDRDFEETQYFRVDRSQSLLETGNSVFRENTQYFDNARVERRLSFSLDHILDLLGLQQQPIDILKLDLQGSELRAIRGAAKAIARSPDLLIVTEASFVPYNGPHAPSFFELHAELHGLGFVMVDLLGYSSAVETRPGGERVRHALQFDAAWVRREKATWRGVAWPPPPHRE